MSPRPLSVPSNGFLFSGLEWGPADGPLVLLLHGFPDCSYTWRHQLPALAAAGFHAVAPDLRGYDGSSRPKGVAAYSTNALAADIAGLVTALGAAQADVVAHDWGGAVAWTFAALQPARLKRLVIVNSPHPATFLRGLQHNPEQQAASSYMNFLCRPDAEKLLTENDFARLWPMFTNMGAADPSREGGGWLTEPVRDQYRAIWSQGMTGGCNYYRASPLRPPTAQDSSVMKIVFAPEFVTVRLPTLVIWAEDDIALPPPLVDGLDAFVPAMRLVRVPGATHWIVHERPHFIAAEIERHLAAHK